MGDMSFGAGVPSTPPDVFSEGGFGNSQASADVFKFNGPAVSTIMASPGLDSKAVLDGDGLAPPGLPGMGLVEPNWFNWGNPTDYGDNLDAIDMNTRTGHLLGPIFYSLDSYFTDTFEIGLGGDPNAGTAMGNVDVATGINFSGAGVLVKTATVGPTLYASAASLGLDKFGYDTDDLDALALLDDGKLDTLGNPYFTPGNDRLLFSVRRDSAVIGTLDGLHGISIEPGDILLPPTNPLGQPGIFITAKALGLATIRSGTTSQNAGDDLNALDVVGVPCDLNFDTLCDVADIDSLYSTGNLGPGVALPGPPADYDLDVDNDDLTTWLSEAATHNGFATSYRRGDTELDRDVDLTDFLNLAGNFDPAGAAGPHPWAHGNFDGDMDVDLADFNSLATNFAAAGYAPQINAAMPEPSAILLALLAICGAQLCLRRRN